MVPVVLALWFGCTSGGTVRRPPDDSAETGATDSADTEDTVSEGPCPPDTALVGAVCMDRYEAPNRAGAQPLVMFHLYEAQAWCAQRGRRLCYDDEWTAACAGDAGFAYPYGATREPGRCNDEETWRAYEQSKLNGWPSGAASPSIDSVEALFEAARTHGTAATTAADHVAWLYQGEGGGDNAGCVGAAGVYDLQGNVEEWTLRRDGGSGPDFTGNLKGRYWAEPRTCQSGVTTHGNAFRFYEIGFRCCVDPAP